MVEFNNKALQVNPAFRMLGNLPVKSQVGVYQNKKQILFDFQCFDGGLLNHGHSDAFIVLCMHRY